MRPSASLGPSCNGCQLFWASHCSPEISPCWGWRKKPFPMSGNTICDRGARSPEAPSDPCSVTTGYHCWLYMADKRSKISGRMAEYPLLMFSILSQSMVRTRCILRGLPTPAAWVISKFSCNALKSWAEISTFCKEPNPVFTP